MAGQTDHCCVLVGMTAVQHIRSLTGTTMSTLPLTPTSQIRGATTRIVRQRSPIAVSQAVKLVSAQPGSQPQIISIPAGAKSIGGITVVSAPNAGVSD